MADHTQELCARVYLRSVVPLMKVLVEERPFYQKLMYRACGVVQFTARDSEQAAHLILDDGALDVKQGVHEAPSITLSFKTLADMNTFFAGGVALPGVKRIRGIGSLLRVLPLLLKLKILMPDALPTDPDERALKVKLLLYMVSNGLSQLNKGGDPDMKKYVAKSPERVFQWTVEGGGPAAYLRIKGGKSKAGRGTYTRRRPYVHMLFPDIDGAFGVLTQQVSTVDGVREGKLRMEGAMEGGKEIGVFMQRLEQITTGG